MMKEISRRHFVFKTLPIVFGGLILGCRQSSHENPQSSLAPIMPESTSNLDQIINPQSLLPLPEEPPVPEPEGKLAGKRIGLDPGHDPIYSSGTAGRNFSGNVPYHPVEGIPIYERELVLKISHKLKTLLEIENAEVCITRNEDGSLVREPYDFTQDGLVRSDGAAIEDGAERIQPRIDQINEFGAEIAISIHFNGLEDRTVRGTEIYYSNTGPNQENNKRLAQLLMTSLLEEMTAAGFKAQNRGILSDRYARYSPDTYQRILAHNAKTIIENGHDPASCYDCRRLLILGNNPMSLHSGNYIGALVEVEFLSNPQVVEEFVMRPDSLDIVAVGLAKGIIAYFNEQ